MGIKFARYDLPPSSASGDFAARRTPGSPEDKVPSFWMLARRLCSRDPAAEYVPASRMYSFSRRPAANRRVGLKLLAGEARVFRQRSSLGFGNARFAPDQMGEFLAQISKVFARLLLLRYLFRQFRVPVRTVTSGSYGRPQPYAFELSAFESAAAPWQPTDGSGQSALVTSKPREQICALSGGHQRDGRRARTSRSVLWRIKGIPGFQSSSGSVPAFR